MTDKEKLDAIEAEILRLVNVRGYDREMANDLLTFMGSLPNKPVSEDLEKASYYFACKCHPLKTECGTSSPNPEVIEAFETGSEWQKERFISKACEYLKDNIWRNLYFVNGEAGFPTAEFIKGFRKAMEE